MALRNILKIGDPLLRRVSREQKKFDEKLACLLDDMKETMYSADGVGLAAPQIAILRRIFVVDIRDGEHGLVEFINPEIIERDGKQVGVEGCLSVPGKMGLVDRPMHIVVRAQDRNGETFTLEAEGFFARAICHEFDHLNGVLYPDIMEREITQEELEKQREKARQKKAERQAKLEEKE